MLFGIIVLCRLVFCDDVLQLLFPKCSPNVPQILNEQAIAAGKLWLDIPGAAAIMEIKRALRQAVNSFKSMDQEKALKPSLARVAAFAMYNELKHQLSQCKSYCQSHALHPLSGGVANRLPFCATPSAPYSATSKITHSFTDCKSFRSIQTERGDPNNGTASYFFVQKFARVFVHFCIFLASMLQFVLLVDIFQ